MKRSNMIGILAGYLSGLKFRSNLHPEDYKSTADEILKLLEEEGMLPPATDHYQEKSYTKDEVELASDMIFSWKPENE